MSKLKIFINDAYEIRALHYTDDTTLKEYIIDREKTFGNHSDAYILGYKYEPITDNNGLVTDAIVTPYMDLYTLRVAEQSTIESTTETSPTIIVNHSTLEELKAFHIKALGRVGSALIHAGIDVKGKHYSLTDQDQTNILVLYNQCITGSRAVAYHADGNDCEVFTADEMIEIAQMAQMYVTFHTTRMNQLFNVIRNATTKKQVMAVTYQFTLPNENQIKFDNIMETLGVSETILDYFNSTIEMAGEVEGEIYSNTGSMIEPVSYDTEEFLDVDTAYTTATDDGSTNVIVPCLFVDPDKINNESSEYAMSCVFNVCSNVDGNLERTYSPDYSATYCLDEDGTSSNLVVNVSSPVVLTCIVPVGLVYNELTDRVNREESFYIIKTEADTVVTTDPNALYKALGITVEQ